MTFARLIHLPNREAHKRAVAAWLRVRQPRHVFPGRRMLVTVEHVAVLEQEGIPFRDITESSAVGRTPAGSQAKR
jgi:hypothetical protein